MAIVYHNNISHNITHTKTWLTKLIGYLTEMRMSKMLARVDEWSTRAPINSLEVNSLLSPKVLIWTNQQW